MLLVFSILCFGTGITITILFPFTGCFTSCLFKSKIRATPGAIIQFSYFELESATDKFSNSNLIGLGGSSYVYRGQLKGGRIVAVKRLKAQQGPDSDSVFITEVIPHPAVSLPKYIKILLVS